MYCSNCGTQLSPGAEFCAKCGARVVAAGGAAPAPPAAAGPGAVPGAGPGAPPEHIPNYLVQAILLTLFCCLPFGIVAIVYAARVSGKVAAGDLAGARADSRNAKTWCWVAFATGMVGFLGYLALVFAGLASRMW
jgi:hypothetical protein